LRHMKKFLIFLASILVVALIVFVSRRGSVPNKPTSVMETQTILTLAPPKIISNNITKTNEKFTKDFSDALTAQHSAPFGDEFLANVKKLNVDVIIEDYRKKTNLVDRIGLMWALALSEDERVVGLFKNTLFNEFNGQKIRDPGGIEYDDEYVMIFTVFGFGFLGRQNDQAYELIKSGTNPDFWKQNIKWTTSDTGDSLGVLTAMCIHALGITERPDVPQILEDLKKSPLINTADPDIMARTFDGDLLQAAFYRSLVKERGMDGFKKWLFRPPSDIFDEDGSWGKWCSSPDGQQWVKWKADWEKNRKKENPPSSQ
jgi:hypothetical protein